MGRRGASINGSTTGMNRSTVCGNRRAGPQNETSARNASTCCFTERIAPINGSYSSINRGTASVNGSRPARAWSGSTGRGSP
eukprot:3148310-Rhodomonas_salina.1